MDAFLTFLGDVIFNLTSCEMAACVFFLKPSSSCFLSPNLDAGIGSVLHSGAGVAALAVLLFLLDVLIPISLTFTRLIGWPGTCTISCHVLIF